MAERVIDVLMLGIVCLLFIITNYENLDVLANQIQNHPWLNKTSNNSDINISKIIGECIKWIVIICFIGAITAYIFNKK